MDKVNNIKLNLDYVSNIIGEEYKDWKSGDIVKIKAQTGTGKTYFIKNVLIPYIDEINEYKIFDKQYKVLILTNRTNLSRQIKKDLYTKYKLEMPSNIDEIDTNNNIENITIMSYQSLNEFIEKNIDIRIDKYDYIVCDEIQYILDDSWTGRTETILNYLTESKNNSVKIFISATMEQLDNILNNSNGNIFEYDTNRDYSYLIPYTYSENNQLINQIIKDKTNNKWLIFVSKIKKGNEILNKLNTNNIDATIVYRGCKDKKAKEELNNIINNEQFSCKVLITTKLLDNGINISDDKVKNIVVTSWSKINLIQSIGRVRFKNIKEAYKINLYLDIKKRKQFSAKIQSIDNTLQYFELLKSDKEAFNNKYRKKLNQLPNGIHLNENNKFIFDKITYANLIKNKLELEEIKNNYYKNKYIEKQLNWLGIETDVIDLNEIEQKQENDEIKEYALSLIDKPLNKKEQEELIKKINLRDNYNRLQKCYSAINVYLENNYNLHIKRERPRINGIKTTIWKIIN